MPKTVDLAAVYDALKPVLAALVPTLSVGEVSPGRFTLRTDKTFEAFGRKREGIEFASLIVQKNFVGFYFLPVYANPALIARLHPDLQKRLKGKACFHLTAADEATQAHLAEALRVGLDDFRARGWAA